jgi:dienelactone hydrolase
MPPGHKLIKRFDDIDCDRSGFISSIEFSKFFKGGRKKCSSAAKRGENISSDRKSYSALLNLPKGNGPFPVAVISHGKGGAAPVFYTWGEKISEWGFAAIVFDHYGPRDFDVGATPRPDTEDSFNWRRNDLISLLRVINADERLDKTRVTLGGWSRGGGLVMHGIMDKGVRDEAKFKHPFKSAILFYPQSNTIFENFSGKIETPTLFLSGSEDYIWVHGWKDKLEKYKSDTQPMAVKIYNGAYHAFDGDFFKTKKCDELEDGPHCFLYDAAAYASSIEGIKNFLKKHAK